MVLYRMRLKGSPSMVVLLVVALSNLNIFGTGPTAGAFGGAVMGQDLTRTHILAVESAHLDSEGDGGRDHQDETVLPGAMATSDPGSRIAVINSEERQSEPYSVPPKAEIIPVPKEERNSDLDNSNEFEDIPFVICYGPNAAQQTIGSLGLISVMAILVVSFLELQAFCK